MGPILTYTRQPYLNFLSKKNFITPTSLNQYCWCQKGQTLPSHKKKIYIHILSKKIIIKSLAPLAPRS